MAHGHAPTPAPTSGPKVLGVSPRNPRVRTIQVGRPAKAEASFIPAALKGLAITVKHFFRNVSTGADIATIQYPEEKQPYPERNRGLHRLMLRDDGSVRCVACMCCPTVCPANCITIVPAEATDGRVEKYPLVFEIDELRCVVCGLCVEACPCDAIRMDTGKHAASVEHRAEGVLGKADLLAMGKRSIATQGGEGPEWRASDEPKR
jgi:NADH-quinone oxidoreductase subunit I